MGYTSLPSYVLYWLVLSTASMDGWKALSANVNEYSNLLGRRRVKMLAVSVIKTYMTES